MSAAVTRWHTEVWEVHGAPLSRGKLFACLCIPTSRSREHIEFISIVCTDCLALSMKMSLNSLLPQFWAIEGVFKKKSYMYPETQSAHRL